MCIPGMLPHVNPSCGSSMRPCVNVCACVCARVCACVRVCLYCNFYFERLFIYYVRPLFVFGVFRSLVCFVAFRFAYQCPSINKSVNQSVNP